jgi:hypothetical protein
VTFLVQACHDVTNVTTTHADIGRELVERDGATARLLVREVANDMGGEGTDIK